jgi:diguanylate cyclase (GGDEF)-like protein/PAS domain S-box-containing protein
LLRLRATAGRRHVSDGHRPAAVGLTSPELADELIAAAPVAMIAWDHQGRVLAWNPAAEAIFGWRAGAVIGKPCPVLATPMSEPGGSLRDYVLAGGRLEDEELPLRRADGTLVYVSLSAAPVEGDLVAAVAVAIDITGRAQRTRLLRHFASHDPLTDLHNRRAFEQSLQRVLERVRRGGARGALLVVDVDRLKQVNDTLGHLAGDSLLVAVANVLRQEVRPGDFLARLGGDEFVIALEGVGMGEAALIAERLRASIAARRIGPDGRIASTVSIGGIAIDGGLDVTDLLAAADQALYVAKRTRDSVEISAHPNLQALERGEEDRAAKRLRLALGADALAVHYQRVLYVDDGRVHSEEAFARVQLNTVFHPAVDFVSIAEHAGLIGTVDARVLNLVLDRLLASPRARVSVNLSAASLTDPGTLELLRERAPSGGYGDRLILEVAETHLHADPAGAADWAATVHALGATIAVDDIGADPASLAVLAALPIEIVKLDPSLLLSLESQPGADRVRAIAVACARAGIDLVAKGIEDWPTLRALQDLGVELGQGYLLDEPHLEPTATVDRILEAIKGSEESLGVSLDLVAWAVSAPAFAIAPAWLRARREGLIEPVGIPTGASACGVSARSAATGSPTPWGSSGAASRPSSKAGLRLAVSRRGARCRPRRKRRPPAPRRARRRA